MNEHKNKFGWQPEDDFESLPTKPQDHAMSEQVELVGGPWDGAVVIVPRHYTVYTSPARNAPTYRRDPANPRRFVYVQPADRK